MNDDKAPYPYAGYDDYVMIVQHTGDGFNEVEHGEDEFKNLPGAVLGSGKMERLRDPFCFLQKIRV